SNGPPPASGRARPRRRSVEHFVPEGLRAGRRGCVVRPEGTLARSPASWTKGRARRNRGASRAGRHGGRPHLAPAPHSRHGGETLDPVATTAGRPGGGRPGARSSHAAGPAHRVGGGCGCGPGDTV